MDNAAELSHVGARANDCQPLHIDIPEPHDTDGKPEASSEDEFVNRSGVDESEDEVMEFSISRAQTHIKSPHTPAIEKIRAIQNSNGHFVPGFIGDPEDVSQEDSIEERDGSTQQAVQRPSDNPSQPGSPLMQWPSPWKAPSSDSQQWRISRADWESGTRARQRSFSGSSMLENLRKHLPDIPGPIREFASSKQLKSTPNSRLQHVSIAENVPEKDPSDELDKESEQTSQHVSSQTLPLSDGSMEVRDDMSGTPLSSTRSRSLRRSNSDNSLYLARTSTAQSRLDDLTQFADISDMINSRFKAITDTLQDSALRRPKLPNINLAALKSSALSWSYTNISKSDVADTGTPKAAMSNESHVHKPQAAVEKPSQRAHPILADALSKMEGDVIVLGGYRGSILRSAKPPHHQLWAPVKLGMNLRKADLEVGLTREDEERMEETIFPDGMLSHIGPIDISRRLIRHLRKCPNTGLQRLRVHDYGYDWRLSPDYLANRLMKFLEGLKCNQPHVSPESRGAWVIAHSLGGLITRHVANRRPELFAGVIYAGTPQNCVNILGPLRNGDDVLRNSRVLNAQVNFTLRTSYALLPEDGRCFINKSTGERYDVDFFNPQTWDEYRLSPCIKHALPPTVKGEHRKTLMDSLSTLPRRLSLGSSKSKDGEAPLTEKMVEAEGALEPSLPKDTTSRPPIATTSTLPVPLAKAYLAWVLTSVLAFKKSLFHDMSLQQSNLYPPHAVIYAKNTPTVYGAYVSSREAIKHADAYDDLAFAGGDGVVLASASQLPEGYRVVKGGKILSERGHVGLLGDLDGVGKCLNALIEGRNRGIGLGPEGLKKKAA